MSQPNLRVAIYPFEPRLQSAPPVTPPIDAPRE